MKTITLREFIRKPTKYTKEPVLLTRHGVEIGTFYPYGYKDTPKISKLEENLREIVFIRDGYKCKDCGTKEDLSIDHIIPQSIGGRDTIDNYDTVCKSCNTKRYQSLLRKAMIHYHECPLIKKEKVSTSNNEKESDRSKVSTQMPLRGFCKFCGVKGASLHEYEYTDGSGRSSEWFCPDCWNRYQEERGERVIATTPVRIHQVADLSEFRGSFPKPIKKQKKGAYAQGGH